MAIGLTNTVPRSSCGKCVKVLKELISGLQDDVRDSSDGNDGRTRTSPNTISRSYEPPPLTLLRAIARSSQDHRWHDKWGQERTVKLDRDRDNRYKQQQQQQQKQEHHQQHHQQQQQHNNHQTDSGNDKTNADSIADSISDAVSNNANSNSHNVHDRRSLFPGEVRRQHQHQQHQHPVMTIEETEDGVKLTIPVETTAPAFMKKWTELEQQQQARARARASEGKHQGEHNETSNDEYEYDDEAGGGGILEDWIPLATSVRRDEDDEHSSLSAVSSSSLSDAAEAEDPHAAAAVVVTNPLTIELKCRRCETSGPEAGARAFLMGPQPLSIVLCHNRIDSDKIEVEEILTHELVHLYDVQTLQLDLSDCETVAYSEVRAAREAECDRSVKDAKAEHEASASSSSSSSSASSGLQAVTTQISETLQTRVYKPYCVRNIALGATQNMFPSEGKACLNKVWDTAYGDHRPFARHHEAQQQTQHSQEQQHNGSSNGINHKINSGTSHGTSDK